MHSQSKHNIKTNRDGSILIEYHPIDTGVHEVNLNYNDQQLEGTPIRCIVDSIGNGYVTAFGSGLNYGSSGKDSIFTIVGGGNDLSINIDGPSKAEITKKDIGSGATEYKFLPMSPGEYLVNIKAKGKHIHGSPFSCKVSGEGRKRCQLSLTATSDVALGDGKDIDLANAKGILKMPSGNSEACLLKKNPDGRLFIASFQPKTKGQYIIDVTQEGHGVKGSPFKLDVTDSNVSTASQVKASGAVSEGKANTWNEVFLDISNAGYGSLGVSVEGPHRSDLDCKSEKPRMYKLSYKPHEPGIYLLNIRFGDEHITGSPFMVSVGGEPSGRVRETVVKNIGEVQPVYKDTPCEFQLKIPGTDPLDMEATLTAPSGKSELCEISDLPEALYDIRFKPWEEGVHTVSLKHKGLHISGSPFQYTVGSMPAGGTHKVEIGGTGLEKGEVHQKNEFNIYTREAGPGALSVSVEGPSKAKLDVVDRGHGYTTVSYVVEKPGEYGIHVKYNDVHVPDSPTMVYVVPDSADAKKVTIHGLRDRGLEVDKPATFHLNMNGARGNLHAHLNTPSGSEEDIFIQELDRDMYAVRFVPKENGIYYVHIKLNEAHIPGSPFPMLVGQLGADPALVIAKGEGLEKGTTGKACKFIVVTTNAGHGTLNVIIQGPSRTAIICTELDEGYEFTYTPMAPGDYLINIKYCNVTIAGCPTKASVTGAGKPSEITETSGLSVETVEKKPGAVKTKRFMGDANKIMTKGNGLKKGFINRTNTFTIETKDAGQAMLTLGLMSPSGNPVEELTYKKTRPTIYTVNYRCREKGEYQMIIRWGNEDVPGSPFNITVS
ncbi:hypothetical protein LSH36_125g02020 [Paralvinella palmiformis]|uniref:Filamin n=1 Tax=Paralvinella palmiformis TaxID=53620 RepID=A0AAD9JY75_9ANNE|nr:hypothetical protein LSH36_125g02020 [Paralvinella palmiformis]